MGVTAKAGNVGRSSKNNLQPFDKKSRTCRGHSASITIWKADASALPSRSQRRRAFAAKSRKRRILILKYQCITSQISCRIKGPETRAEAEGDRLRSGNTENPFKSDLSGTFRRTGQRLSRHAANCLHQPVRSLARAAGTVFSSCGRRGTFMRSSNSALTVGGNCLAGGYLV